MTITTQHSQAERILETAIRLFTERGFSNISVRDICSAADTTPPMIYYYFRHKKGLFEAAVRKTITMESFIEELSRKMSVGRTPHAKLEAFIDSYLSSFPDGAFSVGLYIRESASLDRGSAKRIMKDLDRVHELASIAIKEGIDSGGFRKTDPKKAADCLLGVLNRVIFQRIHFSRNHADKATAGYIKDFFFRAMGK